ncbi:MAG: zf-HC2 domain-containing protein [Vicinamibacterales bacterium]
MTLLDCSAVRRLLAAFHDDELAVPDRISMQGHLNGCEACAAELMEFQEVAGALRLAAAPAPADDWTGLQPGVVSRMRAEANEAWPARLSRMFDDMHLVWIAAAALAGTLVCGSAALTMLHFALSGRADSLAAMIEIIAAPEGSNLNPASLDDLMQAPTVPEDGAVKASLERFGTDADQNLALSAVITREGNISGLEVLGDARDQRRASELVNEISRGRLEPARSGSDPIAVNLVWFVEHMTVRPKQRG